MNSTPYKILNATNTIEQSLPAIIEAFVSFYGEENRNYIEEKFNNTIMIGYGVPTALEKIIRKTRQNINVELINNFFDKAGIIHDRKKFNEILFGVDVDGVKLFGDVVDLKDANKFLFSYYVEYIESPNEDLVTKKYALLFLQRLNPDITLDNMDKLIEDKVFSDIDRLIPLYKEMLKQYSIEIEKIKYLEQQKEDLEKLEHNLEDEYWLQLLDEFSYLFPLQEITRVKNQKLKGEYLDSNFIELYLGTSLMSTPLVYSFSEKSEEILVTGKDWQKKSVINDRIKFFKKCGINLGNDYELYKNNEQCKKLIPSQSIIEKIESRKKELFELKMNQYYKSTTEYKVNREKINKNNLLNKDDGYDAYAYYNEMTFIKPNIVYRNGKYSLLPIMCININHPEEYLDSAVIHELNHVFELHLVNGNDKFYDCVSGWENLKGVCKKNEEQTKSLDEGKANRKYELFDEIINVIISQEITTILHASGNYIFNTKDNAKIKDGTSYEYTLFLVEEFYETYKKEILESRKTGDIQLLFDTVGKENFEKLNDLFNIFYDNFSSTKIYLLHEDIVNDVENEDTIKYKKIIQERDKILADMKMYSLKNKKNNR